MTLVKKVYNKSLYGYFQQCNNITFSFAFFSFAKVFPLLSSLLLKVEAIEALSNKLGTMDSWIFVSQIHTCYYSVYKLNNHYKIWFETTYLQTQTVFLAKQGFVYLE